ncbi:hypothetical protein V2H45_17620 [Tumidithrix elongata RA019]|uniref:Uncharacterized protein n=1 Tax=Tumidithrix elongata BACA0141 TaxID=2716417 RepID=A0AAW9PZX0_9CYAN|nr:hypothetical protein [Tumidithrix elongata RA019]
MNLEINFESLKTLAAFGGFLSLLVQIYDKFIAKPRLDVEVEYSGLISKAGTINFKIDVSLVALVGDVSIKEVYIFNAIKEEYCFWKRRVWYRELPFTELRYREEASGDWHIKYKSSTQKIRLDKAVKGQMLF